MWYLVEERKLELKKNNNFIYIYIYLLDFYLGVQIEWFLFLNC